MFFKIVFFLSVGAVLTFNLEVTPDQLRVFFQDIDTQVTALEDETIIQIRTNDLPLANYISNSRTGLSTNMTDAGKNYWAVIRSLEETAKEKGKNYSPCIKAGNDLLLTLNNSIIIPAYQAFERYNNTGYEIINSSLSEAYGVILELTVLEEVVGLCNDATCATDLYKVVTQYYARAKATLIDAETKATNYVNDALPALLDHYRLDTNVYVSNYTVILNNVTACANNV